MNLDQLTEFVSQKTKRMETYSGTKSENVYIHFLQCLHTFAEDQMFTDEK